MEKSVGTIVTKIDAVIVKLEAMEKDKAKKREAMSRILETMHKEEGGIFFLIILIIKTILYNWNDVFYDSIWWYILVDDERKLSMMESVVRDELASLDASRPATAANLDWKIILI